MNMLCLTTNLTSSEMAAWVQAVGSIIAILAAGGFTVLGAWLDRRNARHDRRQQRYEIGRTLSVLSQNLSKAMTYIEGQLESRTAVYEFAEGHRHFDFAEMERLDFAISAIPLHELPSPLVTPAMLLGATFRQFKEKIELAMRVHKTMDAVAFDDFFRSLAELNQSMRLTCGDVGKAVTGLEVAR